MMNDKGQTETDKEALIWWSKVRETNKEYQIYLACADDGKGGDITRGGAPLKTYEEWLNS